MKKIIGVLSLGVAALIVANAQNMRITISREGKPRIAVPDFRGAGDAQKFMSV